jgi:hypothetical protein
LLIGIKVLVGHSAGGEMVGALAGFAGHGSAEGGIDAEAAKLLLESVMIVGGDESGGVGPDFAEGIDVAEDEAAAG